MKDSLKPLVDKVFRKSFFQIKNFAAENNQVIEEEKAPEPDFGLMNVVANQAVVNTQLQLRHQRQTLKVLKVKQQQSLMKALAIRWKTDQYNKLKIQSYLKRWSENIYFPNAKVKEYIQCLEVLENEKDLLTKDIHFIEQLNHETENNKLGSFRQNIPIEEPDSPSNAYNSQNKMSILGRQIRYLEFLEIQNSNLMEVLKPNEYEFEDDLTELQAIEEELEIRRKRCYSI